MNAIKNAYTLTEKIKSNIAVFGHFEAAKLMKKKILFTLYHYMAFGYLPRAVLNKGPVMDMNGKNLATWISVRMR